MQKWEYACIFWYGDEEPTLIYLHPAGEKIINVEKEKRPEAIGRDDVECGL